MESVMPRDYTPRFKKGMPPKKAKTPLKRTPLKKKFNISGELLVMQNIWFRRTRICFVTGKEIKEFNVQNFAHILSKGAFGRYRLLQENIALLLPEIHTQYDFGPRDPQYAEGWARLDAKHDELKKRYYK